MKVNFNQQNIYFTKQERKALIVFALLTITFMFIIFLIAKYDKPQTYQFKDLAIDSLMATSDSNLVHVNEIDHEKDEYSKPQHQRFTFNPNTISEDSMRLLGINSYAINNLVKYRNKGGKIKDLEHFYKIYGMDKHMGEFDEYINLDYNKNALVQNYNTYKKDSVYKSTPNQPKEINPPPISKVNIKTININTADSFELQMLKGIGPYLAKKIITYRDALGGFFEVEQVEEVYGMKPETYMNINHLLKVDATKIRKLKINSLDAKQLTMHPYINGKQGSIIIKYRNNHGPYKSIDDVKKIGIFNDDDINRLKWYLEY